MFGALAWTHTLAAVGQFLILFNYTPKKHANTIYETRSGYIYKWMRLDLIRVWFESVKKNLFIMGYPNQTCLRYFYFQWNCFVVIFYPLLHGFWYCVSHGLKILMEDFSDQLQVNFYFSPCYSGFFDWLKTRLKVTNNWIWLPWLCPKPSLVYKNVRNFTVIVRRLII